MGRFFLAVTMGIPYGHLLVPNKALQETKLFGRKQAPSTKQVLKYEELETLRFQIDLDLKACHKDHI